MKILIPVDGSPCSNAALDFVASRAALMEREPDIRVLNVQPMLSPRIVRMGHEAHQERALGMDAELDVGEDAGGEAVGELNVGKLFPAQPEAPRHLALGGGDGGAHVLRAALEPRGRQAHGV